MYLIIIFLLFVNSFILGFFGRYLGVKGSHFLSILCLSICLILGLIGYFEIIYSNSIIHIYLFNWLDIEFLTVDFNFTFDPLTINMILVVLLISFAVNAYSMYYMFNDPHNQRFFCYINLFSAFMLILLSGNNLLLLFLGWEGIGITSYLLINFWFTRINANLAGIKALLINRFGDFGLTISLYVLALCFSNIDFSTMFPFLSHFILYKETFDYYFGLWTIGIIVGGAAKSAQLGLHFWLPNSMEGPTPVSALIHAATLVTSGIVLLIKVSPILNLDSNLFANTLILYIGSLTLFVAGLLGSIQTDLKRIIAYSTCSQLGLLFVACGLSLNEAALFHLINHAFFKALLFLAAGAIIHSNLGLQDIRKFGSLNYQLPFSYILILLSVLNLIAFPAFSGFYSKEYILESLSYFINYHHFNIWYLVCVKFTFLLAFTGTLFTSFYSFRLLILIFLTKPNGNVNSYVNIIDFDIKAYATKFTVIALTILAIISIIIGYFLKDSIIGLGSENWQTYMNINLPIIHYMPNIIIGYLPYLVNFLGLLFCLIYIFNISYLIKVSKYIFNVDYLISIFPNIISKKWLDFSYITFKLIDKSLFNGSQVSNFFITFANSISYQSVLFSNIVILPLISIIFIIVI